MTASSGKLSSGRDDTWMRDGWIPLQPFADRSGVGAQMPSHIATRHEAASCALTDVTVLPPDAVTPRPRVF